jgi:hypothetical protein
MDFLVARLSAPINAGISKNSIPVKATQTKYPVKVKEIAAKGIRDPKRINTFRMSEVPA